jgi:tetratricopeptide (TPR) repeat protein/predicted Ser/Thr protein kinase
MDDSRPPSPDDPLPPPADSAPSIQEAEPAGADEEATLPPAGSAPGGSDAPIDMLWGGEDLTGRQVGVYRIRRFLGAGGMARVYEAFDTRLQRPVALKFLRFNDSDSAARLIREAQAQAQVRHDGVCAIYEAGEDAGRLFIAMQFIQGPSLDKAAPDLSVREKVETLRQVAEAVHTAHREGLIHRDLKPSNILLERTETGGWKAYVTDFGLARVQGAAGLTATGEVMGTPRYMAPEQARGDNRALDARTDVYSLGATMYEILSGRPLFAGDSPVHVMLQVMNRDPITLRRAAPHLHADLDTIVMKCLEKDPSRRYPSARELAADLERFLEGDPIQARPAGRLYRLYRRARKNRIAVTVALAAVLALAALVVYGLRQRALTETRTRLASEFSQDLRYIEERLRYARTAPRHDIRPDLRWVEDQTRAIERRMVAAGPAAEGPGHFALGRCALLLRDYDEARTQLDAAWNGARYQIPEVAQSLGLTLAHLYQVRWDELSQEPRTRNIARQLEEINTRYREPALRFIRQAGDAPGAESPEVVEAIVAALESRYTEALTKIGRALARTPWQYELRRLEADVRLRLANEKLQRGDLKEGLEQVEKAEATLLEAVRQAPSDPDLYLLLAQAGLMKIINQSAQTGRADPRAFEQARRYAVEAQTIQPGLAVAAYYEGLICFQWAEYLLTTGGDVDVLLREAIASTHVMQAADAYNAQGPALLGAVYQLRANAAMSKGQDPQPDLQKARDALAQAIRLDPEAFAAHLQLGNTYFSMARARRQARQSPAADYRAALESYRQAARIDDSEIILFLNMTVALANLADYELTHGGNPQAELDESIRLSKRILTVNPGLLDAQYMLGFTHYLQGRRLAGNGQDPSEEFRQAEAELQRRMENGPHSPELYNLRASLHILAAVYDRSRNLPADVELTAARQWLQRSLTDNPGEISPRQILIQLELVTAWEQCDRGRSPQSALARAEAGIRRLGSAGAVETEAWMFDAESALIRGEWASRQGRAADAEITRGLTLADRVLSALPEHSSALACAGALHRLRARRLSDPAAQTAEDRAGREALALAVAKNPLLRLQFGRYLDDTAGMLKR